MKRNYFLALGQYLIYAAVGYLYFVGIATIFGIAAGVGPLGFVFLFLPLVLGGFVSGLSFLQPKLAVLLAIILVIPFLATGVYSVIQAIPASEPWFWTIPAFGVIGISTISLLWSNDSVWSTTAARVRIILAALAAVPAIVALYFVFRIFLWLASFELVSLN